MSWRVRVTQSALADFDAILDWTAHHFGEFQTERLKSDYRYSAAIVYNNFPWPDRR